MNVAFTPLIFPLQVALAVLQFLGVLLHLVVLQHLVVHLRLARAVPLVTRWTPPRGRCLEKGRRLPTWEDLGKSPSVFCIHSDLKVSYNPYFQIFIFLSWTWMEQPTRLTIQRHFYPPVCSLLPPGGCSMGFKFVYHNICRLDLSQTQKI